MINLNGQLINKSETSLEHNRGFLYGDALFETIKVLDKKVLFAEDHYLRHMASMRILRMEIPANFTLEHLESELLKTVEANSLVNARVRLTVYRSGKGKYLPETRNVEYLINVENTAPIYSISEQAFEVELYKDFYISKQLLSTLKTTNRLINISAQIFAEENGYDNCFLINEDKNIIEAINGNIFVVKDNVVASPSISDGCINGIMRKKIIEIIKKIPELQFEERSISPFEIQKADEVFITNVIQGIRPITKYRKKEFGRELADRLLIQLNAQIRFNS